MSTPADIRNWVPRWYDPPGVRGRVHFSGAPTISRSGVRSGVGYSVYTSGRVLPQFGGIVTDLLHTAYVSHGTYTHN
jgi:hypothetical protein